MLYVVGCMMFVFLLCGSGLVVAAVRELILKLYRLTYFRRATGSVVKVECSEQSVHPDVRRHKTQYNYFPVIKFKHLSGREVTFKSEIGYGGETPEYRIGQKISVVYDIDDKLPPMINSFACVWLPPIFLALMGLVFIGSGLMIYFAFGARIFGKN